MAVIARCCPTAIVFTTTGATAGASRCLRSTTSRADPTGLTVLMDLTGRVASGLDRCGFARSALCTMMHDRRSAAPISCAAPTLPEDFLPRRRSSLPHRWHELDRLADGRVDMLFIVLAIAGPNFVYA